MQSPCKGICKIDPDTRLCIGCFRTRIEVKRWFTFSEEEQQFILQSLEQRKIQNA